MAASSFWSGTGTLIVQAHSFAGLYGVPLFSQACSPKWASMMNSLGLSLRGEHVTTSYVYVDTEIGSCPPMPTKAERPTSASRGIPGHPVSGPDSVTLTFSLRYCSPHSAVWRHALEKVTSCRASQSFIPVRPFPRRSVPRRSHEP